MRDRRSAGKVAAATLLLFAAGIAAADGRRVPLAGLVMNDGKSGARGAPTLVGASGEIFEPISAGRWQRTYLGGIAGDVLGAFRDGGRLFAVARTTPLFEQVQGVWYARPLPNRGAITLARGGAPVVAIGRNLHALSKAGFRRIATLPRQPLVIWARDSRQLVAAVEGNGLYRWNGGRWSAIALPLPAGDGIADLVGVNAGELLLRTVEGSLFLVGKSGAKLLPVPGDLLNFTPDAAIQGRDGVRLIGTRAAGSVRQAVLVAFESGGLRLIEAMEELANGDRFSGLSTLAPAGLVATTRQGDVWIRNESAWGRGELLSMPTSMP